MQNIIKIFSEIVSVFWDRNVQVNKPNKLTCISLKPSEILLYIFERVISNSDTR